MFWCLRYTICAYSNCFFASPCSWCSFLKKENRAVRMAMTQWFSNPSRRGYISTLTWSALWIFSQDSVDIFQGWEKGCSLAHISKIVTSRSFHDSQMPQIKGQTEGLYLILSIVTTIAVYFWPAMALGQESLLTKPQSQNDARIPKHGKS